MFAILTRTDSGIEKIGDMFGAQGIPEAEKYVSRRWSFPSAFMKETS